MDDQKEKDRRATELEAKARKELLRRLEHPLKLLKTAGEKERAKREERITSAREYKTIVDAQEAYGWGYLSDDEYHALVESIEKGEEYVENTISHVEMAADMLNDFVRRMASELRGLEFDLLPFEEQIRRMEASEKRREEMEARKAAREEEQLKQAK